MRRSLMFLMALSLPFALFASPTPFIKHGGGYFFNGVDYPFPTETRGTSPYVSLEAAFPIKSIFLGVDCGYSWCRRESWVETDGGGAIGSFDVNYRGRLNTVVLMVTVHYIREVPGFPGANMYSKAGMGLLSYKYHFTAKGTVPTAIDSDTPIEIDTFAGVLTLGGDMALFKRTDLFIEAGYMLPVLKDEDPDMSGFILQGGLKFQ